MPKKPRALKFSSFSKETLGKTIFEARESKLISRSEFARNLGVPRSSLISWESSLRVPDADAIAGICAQLGLDANQLLGLNTVYEGDKVGQRVVRLLDAEGTDAFETSMGISKRALERMLKDGFFGLTTKGIQTIASDYHLSVEWLLTGDPKQWGRSFQDEVSERIRFFRICHGISFRHAQGIEVSWKEGRRGIKAKRKQVGNIEGLLLALQALHGRSPDFPFELAWIATGKNEATPTEVGTVGATTGKTPTEEHHE